MRKIKFTYWQEDGFWVGYLEEYPDYWTQGRSLVELKENLRDLRTDLTSGELPGIRKVGVLTVA